MTRVLALQSMPDEQEWIALLRAGDVAAYERLFRSYNVQLCHYAYRYVRTRDVAQELVQDVFAKLWAERERLDVRESVRAYLYTSVRNHAISHLRHRIVEERWLETPGNGLAGHIGDDVQQRLQDEELAAAVQRVLDQLPTRCRQAITLRWQRRMTYAEVAEVMGISVKTVEIYVTRGLAALRQNFGDLLPYL